jgi:hypothetical protein
LPKNPKPEIRKENAMTRRAKARSTNAEPKPAAAPQPDEAMPSMEEQRYALARKLMLFAADWRRCRTPACKRKRGCAAQGLDCAAEPRRIYEFTDADKAHLKRALERRLAELSAGRDVEA